MVDRKIGREVRKLNILIKRELNSFESVQESNRVTGTHGYILGFLYEHRMEDVFQKDIEKEFGIRRSTATELLKLMEAGGLIQKTPVQDDRRLKKLSLTDKGTALHEKVIGILDDFDVKLKKGISDDELNAFFLTVDKIENNLINLS